MLRLTLAPRCAHIISDESRTHAEWKSIWPRGLLYGGTSRRPVNRNPYYTRLGIDYRIFRDIL